MKSYSLFLRDPAREGADHPRVLAYEIPDRRAAQAMASVIAASYREHGFNPETKVHWFRTDGGVHEIYAWPQG